MVKDTIVILGVNGMLGTYLKRYFQTQTNIKVIGVGRTQFDVLKDDVITLLPYFGETTVVFNAIGTIPQASKDYSISDDDYIKINKEFPHNLSALCLKHNTLLIHPSTDCVFNGKGKGGYVESDIPNEDNIYGKTKYLGEPKKCLVIRTSICGEEIINKRSLVEWVKSNKNKEILGYINHLWNGITCLQYAKIIHQIISQNIQWEGVRHVLSPRVVTKYELCNLISAKFGLGCKIKSHNELIAIDKSLGTIYPENALFNIPDIGQQIMEMYQFSNILYDKFISSSIPKVFYAYWDNSPLSFLQYLTIVTFKTHNPDWKIIIYNPKIRFGQKTWTSMEQKVQYKGKDYLPKLKSLDIEFRDINFEDIGFKNNISEVIKSDYLRYWLLANYGGLWSDMDVLYIKPVSTIFNNTMPIYGNLASVDTVICHFNNHYPIGFLMSVPNSSYFKNILSNIPKNLNIKEYQSIGCHLLLKLYPKPKTIKQKHPSLNILSLTESVYLPYAWDKIPEIFLYNIPDKITSDTIGIHWFNGSPISVEYIHNLPTTGSIYPYVLPYLHLL